jgi:hypothetical protein
MPTNESTLHVIVLRVRTGKMPVGSWIANLFQLIPYLPRVNGNDIGVRFRSLSVR